MATHEEQTTLDPVWDTLVKLKKIRLTDHHSKLTHEALVTVIEKGDTYERAFNYTDNLIHQVEVKVKELDDATETADQALRQSKHAAGEFSEAVQAFAALTKGSPL